MNTTGRLVWDPRDFESLKLSRLLFFLDKGKLCSAMIIVQLSKKKK